VYGDRRTIPEVKLIYPIDGAIGSETDARAHLSAELFVKGEFHAENGEEMINYERKP
jgi:hypothetical protein